MRKTAFLVIAAALGSSSCQLSDRSSTQSIQLIAPSGPENFEESTSFDPDMQALITSVQLTDEAADRLFECRKIWDICALQLTPGVAGVFRFEFIDARRSEQNQLFQPFDVSTPSEGCFIVAGIRSQLPDSGSTDGAVTIYSIIHGEAQLAWTCELPRGSCPAPDAASALDRSITSRWVREDKALPTMCIVCWSWNGSFSSVHARHDNRLLDDLELRLGRGPAPDALKRDVRQWLGPVLGLRMSFVPS